VATAKGDFQTVLRVLGARIDDVPIADSADEVCGVLRANAYERLGQMQTAVEQLVQLMTGLPHGPQLVGRILQTNAHLRLCTNSHPQAAQQVGQMTAQAVQTKGGFKFGCLFLPLFLGGFAIPGFIFLIEQYVNEAYQSIGMGVVIGGYVLMTFVLLAVTLGKGAMIKSKLRQSGVLGRAKIMGASETGTRVNNQPQVQFQLMVNVPGRQPYTAIHREVVSAVNFGRIGPGNELAVRVDPNDPAMLMIDWSQA
jgi:hypothetical protein